MRALAGSDWTLPQAWLVWRHPRRLGWLGDAPNRYGTPTSVLRCDRCRRTVWVCPVLDTAEKRAEWGSGCLGDACESYDLSRDISMMFPPEPIEPVVIPPLVTRILLRIPATTEDGKQ